MVERKTVLNSYEAREGILSMRELERLKFPTLKWLIPGILPMEGVAMVVGSPKSGKSYFTMGVAVDAAEREGADRVNTLYLDLESSHRRIQSRMRDIIGDKRRFPPNIDVQISWPTLDHGGLGRLHDYLSTHNVQVVVVDTWGRIKSTVSPANLSAYDKDVGHIRIWGELALKHGVLVILVHHDNKSATEDDWIQAASGTFGIVGSCDTLLYLRRQLNSTVGRLYVCGRDVDNNVYDMRFVDGRWSNYGPANTGMSNERREVLELLCGVEQPISPLDISKALKKSHGGIRRLVANMEKDGQVVRVGKGQYVDRLK